MENHMVSLQRDFSQQVGGKKTSEEQPLGQCFSNNNHLLHQYGNDQVQNWPPPLLYLILSTIL